MVTLRISRTSGYADYLRAYQVLVDGRTIGELATGETREFAVAPGAHRISLKLDWCGSKTLAFTAVEGQPLAFLAKSNLGGWRVLLNLWYVVVARDEYLLIEQTSK